MIGSRRQILSGLFAGAAGAALAPRAFAQIIPPNTFFSPCGKPFRSPAGAPYPVAKWFAEADKNGDGKLGHDEFIADADAFFTVLDVDGDSVLEHREVAIYEYNIAPEVLGMRIDVRSERGPTLDRPRLWLAQYGGQPGGGHQARDPGALGGVQTLDESQQGASPYSFFQEPEPVMAADFDVNGFITRKNFLKLADLHFTDLDTASAGFLTLSALPKTPVELALDKQLPKAKRR